MRKIIAAALLAGSLTIMAGCRDKTGPGNLTDDENLELNNASEMLDTSPDSLVANDEAPLGNGEEDVVDDANAAGANNAAENPD